MGIIAKYKYDGSVYADLIPEFNAEFTDYTITDEVDSENSNHIIRTIESDSLPTLMRFGRTWVEGETDTDNRTDSLLEVLDMNTSELANCYIMFRFCKNLTSITCEWDTSKVTNMSDMFNNCKNLISLDVSNFDTSKVTNMNAMFYNCNKLTSLDVSNWDTSNVTNMNNTFARCNNINSLNLSKWITNKVTNMNGIVWNCNNLTLLDISNFNMESYSAITSLSLPSNIKYLKCNIINTINLVASQLPTKSSTSQGTIICKSDTTNLDTTTLQSKNWTVNTNPTLIAKYKYDSKIYKNLIPVFNEGYMGFVEDEEVDANGVVTRKIEHVELPSRMRFGKSGGCDRGYSLVDLIYANINELITMSEMFDNCVNLYNCNTEGWNTSNVTDMRSTFAGCKSLITLDVSNFNTSKVTDMSYMFYYCDNLTSLDVSNFDISKVTDMSYMFSNTLLLTDIGMIYCDQSTINKVASLLPTDHNITIWVESDDILQYDQYDHITYKTQKVQDTVHLNSPLLKRDTIEVIDGKTYHVHRYGKVVLDGSENWWLVESFENNNTRFKITLPSATPKNSPSHTGIIHSDRFCPHTDSSVEGIALMRTDATTGGLQITINNSKLSAVDSTNFKAWLSENPTTVIYELASPYYELISEEPLELTLLDTTDNTINNNSILPSNMTIANKELSTIAIKPSTTYTLSFDKSNEDSEVTIDICGGEQITTVLNRVELTTPSELGSGIRFISSDGCIISNVRLLEGGLVESAIPKETFEGLQSSFDEGYIIGENLITTNVSETTGQTLRRDFSKRIYKNATVIIPSEYVGKLRMSMCRDNLGWVNNYPITTTIQHFSCNTDEYYNCVSIAKADITLEELANLDIIILEGDHTHLSEAELMRYIEKGTSHYEEEDYNHVGKYKVEYKVTGKNKFNLASKLKHIANNSSMITHINPSSILVNGIGDVTIVSSIGLSSLLKEGVTYTMSKKGFDNIRCGIGYDNVHSTSKITTFTYDGKQNIFVWFQGVQGTAYNTTITFQLEEGTVATEYEPYKEDIKTYYLSSPLLKGDTIEDINGVATHVRRYGKVVLDGSESWAIDSNNVNYIHTNYWSNPPHKQQGVILSDKFSSGSSSDDVDNKIAMGNNYVIMIKSGKTIPEWVSWLQANPTTVVYELFSPIYEPISNESILCDSYVNGHLDVDTNIPIEKVYFDYLLLALKYVKPSTRYLLQFESDNVGVSSINIGGNTVSEVPIIKGINKVEITTLPTLTHQLLAFSGIGFNASNIQVVEANEDIEFDYFKGLQSSFEDGLVTDENDENYGKYKVACKIVGKNKFDSELLNGSINNDFGELTFSTGALNSVVSVNPIKVMPETTYTISNDLDYSNYIYEYDFNMNYLNYYKFNNTSSFTTLNKTCYVRVRSIGSMIQNDLSVKYQLEEGTQATSYEPYKESIHTLYLNSPLLKGDKLVVHNGKLCHYHKMGMVVFDGSETWNTNANGAYWKSFGNGKVNGILLTNTMNKKQLNWQGNFVVEPFNDLNTADSFKQWLQANPTTVVYELAEPYYEPIEPQLSQYSFSTVKDGDMEIITVLPIEKVNLTYRTDINGVSSIEEQIASIQEGTDISSIIDEEVDE